MNQADPHKPAGQGAAADEWRSHGLLVLAATLGFSFYAVGSYSTGLFMEPLTREFGWSRAEASAGLMMAALFAVPLSPAVGAIVDRWGARRLAIPGIVLSAAALAGFGAANGSIVQWLALWAFYALVTLGVKATIWTQAVSGAFSAGRGLALGVTLCGQAIAQILVPPLAEALIAHFGWRQAYVWLGLGWGAPCLILALFFFRDSGGRDSGSRDSGGHGRTPRADPIPQAAAPLEGLSVREALRSPPILRIAVATLITMSTGMAVLIHQVPILTEAGVARSHAAWLASLAGVAGVAGKLITGWLADRWHAGTLAAISLAIPAIAYVLLLEPFRSPPLIVLAMVIIGYAAGVKLQVSAYLTSRYAGMRNFGKIYGVMTSLVAIGSGLGPAAAGAVYDRFGGYAPVLIAGAAGSLVCGLLLFRLGAYPQWGRAAGPSTTIDLRPARVSLDPA